jgi:uncharacterized membrane protein (DUF2068 family)
VLIALFKLIKGLLLVAAGIGAVKLLHRDVADTVMHWINVLRVDPDNRLIHGLLTKILWVNPNQLKALSAGTFIYAGLLLTEGTGLLLRKTWAEYFTIITTAGLIPLELYEIAKHFTAVKIIVLAVNVAIVVYLVARVRHSRNRPNAPMSRPVPCRTRSPHRFEFRAVSSVSRETHPPCDA